MSELILSGDGVISYEHEYPLNHVDSPLHMVSSLSTQDEKLRAVWIIETWNWKASI